jgi:hypothetical protein
MHPATSHRPRTQEEKARAEEEKARKKAEARRRKLEAQVAVSLAEQSILYCVVGRGPWSIIRGPPHVGRSAGALGTARCDGSTQPPIRKADRPTITAQVIAEQERLAGEEAAAKEVARAQREAAAAARRRAKAEAKRRDRKASPLGAS